MPIPNLFIIGAMKSGTTSLHNYLNAHPDVYMCEPKEPSYFVEEKNYNKGEDWYLDLFKDAGDVSIIGESSTDYTKLPVFKGVQERIKRFNPSAKFIYIMRDPIERIISHYWYSVSTTAKSYVGGMKLETRDMLSAVEKDPEYIAYSDYATQLDPYIKSFGHENIYTLTFEDLVSNQVSEMSAIYQWLGINYHEELSNSNDVWNKTPSKINRFKGRGRLQKISSSRMWDRISPHVPYTFKRLIKTVVTENVEKNTPAELFHYLRPILIPKTEKLEELLQRDFSCWKTLYNNAER